MVAKLKVTMLNSRIPAGPLRGQMEHFKDHCKLVSPNNKKNTPFSLLALD
jgi:hypothetical protein